MSCLPERVVGRVLQAQMIGPRSKSGRQVRPRVGVKGVGHGVGEGVGVGVGVGGGGGVTVLVVLVHSWCARKRGAPCKRLTILCDCTRFVRLEYIVLPA